MFTSKPEDQQQHWLLFNQVHHHQAKAPFGEDELAQANGTSAAFSSSASLLPPSETCIKAPTNQANTKRTFVISIVKIVLVLGALVAYNKLILYQVDVVSNEQQEQAM